MFGEITELPQLFNFKLNNITMNEKIIALSDASFEQDVIKL